MSPNKPADCTDEETAEISESFDSKRFTTRQLPHAMYAQEILAMYLAFDEFGHILWVAEKPMTVLNDNIALTKFIPGKHTPPSQWIFSDLILC